MILTLLVLMNMVRPHALIEDKVLDQRAQVRAEYLCAQQQWSHAGWLTSFKGIKYTYAGENLAKDFASTSQEFNAFMASPTHRANIVKPQYKHVGFGHACTIDVTLFQG